MDLTQLKEHPAFAGFTNADIAKVCGISRQAVFRWKLIPPKCCPAIEAHTRRVAPDQVLTCEQMRPDIDFIRENGVVVKYCVRIKKKDD